MPDVLLQPDSENPGTPGVAKPDAEPSPKKGLSMHEDVPVWYDCCSCEAEPYWVEQFAEEPGEQ
ncbi:MAG: hypothetical protein PVG22_07280 [Chromatiales bacterium]|jgi:hypothetical protein